MAERKLVLQDGTEFYGKGFGGTGEAVFEIVFNTSMVGYQEIISDPSYIYQGVVMTYPIIGSYGITDDDFESRSITVSSLIVREYNDHPSNFRCTKTLGEVMEESSVPCICGVDTRKLTRHIRNNGAMRAIITDADVPAAEAVKKINDTEVKKDAVKKVSCKKRWYARTFSPKYNVVVIDCGARLSVIRTLNSHACNVTVVPYNTSVEEVLATEPDGVFVSNGPGCAKDVPEVVELVKKLIGVVPVCGTCFGHEVIALACGADIVKLKYGHNGSNYPVENVKLGTVETTAQNHSYAVDEASLLGTGFSVTHRNVFDGSVEGIACEEKKVFSLQFSPDSAEGPQGIASIYKDFISVMEENKNA
ncbi:MAG: glutamine-hydrolyzing carbamoyl-phosphate synthase small subunit [Christensenellaceae bacterium]|nr:glutamine-hydrolyzing carbamoyl-phosphate synthase small subunit [Christensenellaceae bacterium]